MKKNGRNHINAYLFEFSPWEGFEKEATLKPLLAGAQVADLWYSNPYPYIFMHTVACNKNP